MPLPIPVSIAAAGRMRHGRPLSREPRNNIQSAGTSQRG
jgi:hypothetical protein